jgi:hypothetical protein
MTEESTKPSGLWARLISEIVSFIPKDMREMIGFQVGLYLFVFTPMVILVGAFALIKLFQAPKALEVPCWQIQKIENRLFKLNSCTGETIELPAPPKVPPKPKNK